MCIGSGVELAGLVPAFVGYGLVVLLSLPYACTRCPTFGFMVLGGN